MSQKILMTTMGLEIGGAETHIVELAKELKKRGYDIVIASNGGVYVEEIEQAGIRHFQIPMNRRKIKYMISSFFKLRKLIKTEKPDVVHAHARIPGFICALVRKTMRFSFVTTAHWVFETGGALKYLTKWGQKTIAVSEDIKDYLKINYHLRDNDIFVTVNGIDTEKFSPDVSGDDIIAEFGLDATMPIISYVSRMDTDRALVAAQLIEIAEKLDRDIPGVQLLIAGGGNIFTELNEKAQRVNNALGRKIIAMTGARTDINKIIAAGDIFVGVSRAALEAMATAKPVIVAGNEGYIGLFSPEKLDISQETNFCCRGCPMSGTELLLEDIGHCFGSLSEEELTQLGDYGRETIFKYYSVQKMASDSIKAYDAATAPPHRVLMSGYYGYNNAGDDAILQAIHSSITDASPNISITVLAKSPKNLQKRYGYNAVGRFNLFALLFEVIKCDVLISGGGSLLQDHTSTRSLLYYLFIIRLAKLFRKKVMLYANGIGPINKKHNRRRVRKTISKVDIITLRDRFSSDVLRNMGIMRDDLHITADPVFLMDGLPKESALSLLSSFEFPTEKPFIAIAVRSVYNGDEFYKKMAQYCDSLYAETGQNIAFVVMQSPNDYVASRNIQRFMSSPSYIFDKQFSSKELIGIIGASAITISMRLHTLVFAARMAVPLLGIRYDPKIDYYLNTLSMPSLGSISDFDAAHAFQVTQELLQNHNHYTSILLERVPQQEQAANSDKKYLLDLLNNN